MKRMQRLQQKVADDEVLFVALKMPHGLELCTYVMRNVREVTLGGHRDVEMAAPSGMKSVVLNGYASPWGMAPRCEVIDGFAITRNVPAKVFNKWWEDNQDSDVITLGLIFADKDHANVRAYCKDHSKLTNGLEPINPMKDPRMPTGVKTFKKDDMGQAINTLGVVAGA